MHRAVMYGPEVPPEKKKKLVENSIYCSCIKTARAAGIAIPMGTDAKDLQPNTTPEEGVLALFSYTKDDHAAYVTKIREHGFWVLEGNYEKCRRTIRFVDWDDPHIRGFYTP